MVGFIDAYRDAYGVEPICAVLPMAPSTPDPGIEAMRRRQVRNFLTLLLTSQGRPMLLMGDEVRRTQRGNNNAYYLDDETSWFNWADADVHRDLLRFTKGLIPFGGGRGCSPRVASGESREAPASHGTASG